jgi:hypothetical protein
MDSDIRCPSLGETLERYHLSDHVPNTPGTSRRENRPGGLLWKSRWECMPEDHHSCQNSRKRMYGQLEPHA